jgi:serine protease Do
MKPRGLKTALFGISCLAILLSACGGGGGAASSLEDAKSAIIQIEAKGSFVDPEVGLMLNVAGRGSGFIIDPSGIAVTNNHVVTGAATLEVWVGGESESHNARILGVSECSDLAVIDIDGDDFPYLQWYEGTISAGMDVYAAGFPLGNPEYTLTKGIVSKEKASGETSWASVDNVIEHDATINPGNSGGPLITPDGEVVGINYASESRQGTQTRFFAIARDEATAAIDAMRSGEDVDSIGINGRAVNNGEGLSGIWVSSVKSGSPADVAGIKGGDVIITIEGLVLATDYTMSDYCDILRTHDPGDTLNVQVLRFSTNEFLEGQINGRPLSLEFSQSTEEGDAAPPPPPPDNEEPEPEPSSPDSEWYIAVDQYGAIAVYLPTSQWPNYSYGDWTEDGEIVGTSIYASSDIDAMMNWQASGVVLSVSKRLDKGYIQVLDEYSDVFGEACDDVPYRTDFENDYYRGMSERYWYCGSHDGPTVDIYSLVSKEDPQAFVATLLIFWFIPREYQLTEDVLLSFTVLPENLP